MDRPYRRFLFPDLAHNAPIPPLLLCAESSALDDEMYRLVFVVCQRFIVPWYGNFTGDRQLFSQVMQVVRTFTHQSQVRLGSIRTYTSGADTALGARAARTRVLYTVGERLPRILLQHVRNYRQARHMARLSACVGSAGIFEKYYLDLCPTAGVPPITDEYTLSDVYLAAGASAFLRQLSHTYCGVPGLRISHVENLLVRDIIVHISRTVLESVAPWKLAAAMHGALDRRAQAATTSKVRGAAHALWAGIAAVMLITWTLVSLVLDAVVWHEPQPKGDDLEMPLVVPSITAHYVELLGEVLELRSRTLGMVCYALVSALAAIIGGVTDRALSRLILEGLYNDERTGKGIHALAATLAAPPGPPRAVPTHTEQAAEFERLCSRCHKLLPETLRMLLLGPTEEIQRHAVVGALAPFCAPDAQVGLLRSAGAQEAPNVDSLPEYEPKCYLCPGNVRASGDRNDGYADTFIFENDFAAMKPEEHAGGASPHPLLRASPVRGRCYVLCFSPKHNLTLAHLTTPPYSAATHIEPIVRAWQSMYTRIAEENPFVKYIQFFENKGSAMGCSSPHPHGQVWSLDVVPTEPAKVMQSLKKYANDSSTTSAAPRDHAGRPCLLLDYANLELGLAGRPRVVTANDDFCAVVPYWAVWPFEVLVLPHRRFIPSVKEMTDDEVASLAAILGEVACRYDNLFKTSFPYSMGIHQRPVPAGSAADTRDEDWDYAIFHMHFYPPLLRSAAVRKFLVGCVHTDQFRNDGRSAARYHCRISCRASP
ncbi:UDP-glucose--hexose-1-phosphate uridylyltransferase [Malassezia cuniculi]|uniref:Galactose-1-phosphate uridylyltransferase n=1 Tax=Malassezia cuniculi TaxID=948313 RepID=A0AAF0ESL6_9BASI|nr:UDP-glucose--hexose-1-phosphate uridylyltransferase [Malassezia cuniculi]